MEGKKLPETKERDDRLLELVEEALLRRATGYEDASGKSVVLEITDNGRLQDMITVLVAVFMFASRIKVDLGEIHRPTD